MAPVLVERVVWKKPKGDARYTPDLTETEIANVKRALAVLRQRHGGNRKLAVALGAKVRTVMHSTAQRRKPSVGLALRAARLAGVPLEDVLSGAWPKAGSCTHCGRHD